ncbi:hypothetical protein B0H66DRAFT_602977 [Apodospora peruviana]|uniref:Uncharacterized protein n=1 Tax=Apodospora peruviana TaxID=516989 RepID=A0AAE0I4R6_9PEZI|nr:hypothetical protein B0H66DRAFT_602977 [Apodospora peruviana]
MSYYCWRVRLLFACGCTEDTATAHICGGNGAKKCNEWITTRSTRKRCTHHRDGASLNKHDDEAAAVDDELS